MAVAKRDKGPSEFGGAPGIYGNLEAREAVKPILEPNQEMTALKQTNKDDPEAWPRHGTGGRRVK